jgi:hypothetical protein
MMRRLSVPALLLLAACSTSPRPAPSPSQPPPTSAPPPVRTGLSGLSQAELVARFGQPSFQLREGTGLKLQWQNGSCVLDVYLYPPVSGGGPPTVLHADARRPGSGDSVPVESCAASLGAR